jgi:sulfonate transport system substrate-binding protein
MNERLNHLLALVLVLLLCATTQAQEKLQKVKIASGGYVIHFLPLDLAVALGYFTDEGLDPEVIYLKGGTATAQALLTKQVDFSTNSIDHAFKAAVQGRDDLRMVVLLNQTPGMVLVVDSKHKEKVNTIADLDGMNLGVTSQGSATHMVLAFLLSKNNVDLKNVSVIKAGTSTFPPALKNGNIDGGIAIEPFASMMVEQGDAFVLQRMITLEDSEKAFGGPYSLTGLLTRQDVIDAQPQLVQKVVNAQVRALKWIHNHSEEEVADALPSEVVGSDKQRYIKTLKLLKDFLSPDGMISTQGAENVLTAMNASGILDETAPPKASDFIDLIYVQHSISTNESNRPRHQDTQQQDNNEFEKWPYVFLTLMIIAGILMILFLISRKRKSLEGIK